MFAYPNSTFLDTFNHDWIRWRYVWSKHVDTLNVLSGSCILSMCLTTMCLTLLLFEYLWIFIDGETSIAGVRGVFLWENYGTRYKDLTTIWWPHGELVEWCRGNHPQIGVITLFLKFSKLGTILYLRICLKWIDIVDACCSKMLFGSGWNQSGLDRNLCWFDVVLFVSFSYLD